MIILLVLLFSKLSIILLYYPIFWFLKWFSPVRKFTVPTSQLKQILRPSQTEWALDSVLENQVLTISGSCANNGLIYIQLIRKDNIYWATIHLLENNALYSGEFQGRADQEDQQKIICGPLLLDMRLPFRRWRVNFRGHLRNTSDNSLEFISISGWWKSVTDAQYFYSNTSPQSFSKLIGRSKLSFVKNTLAIDEYRRSEVLHQMGELFAEIRIGKDFIAENRYRGLRQRSGLGEVEQHKIPSTQFSCFLSDGNAISHVTTPEVEHGLIFKSNHTVSALHLHNLNPKDCMDETNLCPIVFDVSSGLPFEIRKSDTVGKFIYKRPDDRIIDVTIVKVNYALSTGLGFIVRTSYDIKPNQPVYLNTFPEYKSQSPTEQCRLALSFAHRACQDKLLTGGKGSNLARLLAITNQYHVPPGIVVTTTAFDQHVRQNEKIAELIKKLDEPSDEFVEIGLELEREFSTTELSEDLKLEILEILPDAQYYAVRSSAVGEDGAELSSAGQLESYLDTLKSDIFEKLKLCWASNFRREVLNYRRNHGQQLNPSMAVVIQEMNRNGVAGVLFTANPVIIDRSEMVINALRGSGELIVSGVETPDEIHFNRLDHTISSPESCCLEEHEIRHLCQVGEYLENVFGRPQDVEFVYRDGRLNIVQSRDITGLDKETNFEMYYELDTPTFTDLEILSNGNVGEVLPAPLTAMESDQMCTLYDKTLMSMILEDFDGQIGSQATLGFAIHHRKVFMNFGEMMLRTWEACKKDQIIEIVVAGERMFDTAMFQQSAERFGPASKTFDLLRLLKMLKQVFITSYYQVEAVKNASRRCAGDVPSDDCTIDQALQLYQRQFDSYFEAILNHTHLSTFSSFTYVICGMLIRGSDEGDLSDENISDFANVFSNNSRTDVISADVPNSLKKLAAAIKTDNLAKELFEKSGDDALETIRKGENSSEQLREFLNLHGHRGPKELYLDATTWEENTELLVHTIKSMLNCKESVEKTIENEDDILNSLKCKPTGLRRTILKYFIKQTHRGVAFRETSKNHLVSSVNSMRKTGRIIGKKLYEKGYLPDANLWLHLTFDEIKELYMFRKAELVSRAVRRQQIAGKFEGLQFPLITHGHMNPIQNDSVFDHTASLTLRGTTVCEGKVVGKARVARSLDEATQTLPGEILITRYTDISWSPFFPIISGIVTEIGGLLSHGAVVAREYGLPSLIAVTSATQHFKTGDLVELDSIKGTISRLE